MYLVKGVEGPRVHLPSNSQGATATYTVSVVGSYKWMKMGTAEGLFYAQVVGKEEESSDEEEEGSFTSLIEINLAVAVGKMHQAVVTTLCTTENRCYHPVKT